MQDTTIPRTEKYTETNSYKAKQYTREDLSEEISVVFADRWPTGKSPSQYELIYATDPQLDDPILLRCTVELFIPKGTKLLPFDTMSGITIEEKTYWASQSQLINPELASFIDYDWEYKAPEAMEGRVVQPRQPDDEESEFLRLLLTTLQDEFEN